MAEVVVSVVIPTLNSEKTIEKCVESVRNNISSYEYEIIVVDGASNDNTVAIAAKFADSVINSNTHFAGTNRNRGIQAARGNIICFTDSDCIVPENWIETLVCRLFDLNQQDNRIIGVGGGNIPFVESPTFTDMAITKTVRSPLVSFKARNVTTFSEEREVKHNPPMSSAYFKTVLLEVGGFCEEYPYGGEDLELDAKIVNAGYRLFYIPEIDVLHKHKTSVRKYIRQMFFLGKGKIRVGRKFREYLTLFHLGPALLTIMSVTPLIVIPLLMGVINALFVGVRDKEPLYIPHIMFLTVLFYWCYGCGEIEQLLRKNS